MRLIMGLSVGFILGVSVSTDKDLHCVYRDINVGFTYGVKWGFRVRLTLDVNLF